VQVASQNLFIFENHHNTSYSLDQEIIKKSIFKKLESPLHPAVSDQFRLILTCEKTGIIGL